jgi:hypothetical protein
MPDEPTPDGMERNLVPGAEARDDDSPPGGVPRDPVPPPSGARDTDASLHEVDRNPDPDPDPETVTDDAPDDPPPQQGFPPQRHNPDATTARRLAKRTGASRRHLSPILIPGVPTSSKSGRVRRWLGRLLGGGRNLSPPRPAERPTGRQLDDADTAVVSDTTARTIPDTRPLDRADSAPAHDQPVHRATTQLLPGRLQPINPEVIEQEIRFLRARTPRETQVVTLGWNLGDLPEHVTLDHPSIQPLHARMIYQKSHWMIESLTDADPVEINGTLLLAGGVPYLLSSGDQIRIGKALFRFLLP